MKIGVPKEIKPQENRIGLTPESVKTLVSEGHEVIVENNGGFEAGFENEQYTQMWVLKLLIVPLIFLMMLKLLLKLKNLKKLKWT